MTFIYLNKITFILFIYLTLPGLSSIISPIFVPPD